MRLFVKYEPALRAYARTLLPDWHAVDEALQEASVTMWEKHQQLRDEAGFLPWSKVIVRFKCLSAISALRRDRHLLSDDVIKLLADEAEADEAEQHFAAREALRRCLAQFSERHRELLLAPYAGAGEVSHLAERTGRSANALYKLLGRLRAKLANCVRRKLSLETS
jgi:RNA polymerase sigma-70 factor (ECF subfamily)